ncbi:MAG TPA: hypothetical protein DET40_09815 [Lentisphaeria bacterium]|nr:MAG: hypothetical protein A2X45_08600 [Lentisphaerae bacterium GWF2_50_93]HCE43831.1 hypothetical protein [Lentisphaeria bacterium]
MPRGIDYERIKAIRNSLVACRAIAVLSEGGLSPQGLFLGFMRFLRYFVKSAYLLYKIHNKRVVYTA